MREIKGKVILGILLTLFLVIIIAVAALAPTVVVAKHGNDDGSLTYYSYGGSVTVQLPEGVPPHPTTLMLGAFHVQKRGDYPLSGPHDVFVAYIWVPIMNRFIPVAAVSDNPDPAHHDLVKEFYKGTPLWIPGIMENLFAVDDEVVVIWKRHDVFFANLTEGVHVSLDFTSHPNPQMRALGDLSFDLPPMALEIRGIDGFYMEESEATLPSSWSASSRVWRKPAWVRVWIPEWTGGSDAFKFAGVQGMYGIHTWTPPPS